MENLINFVKKNWQFIIGGYLVFVLARKLILPSRESQFEAVEYKTYGSTLSGGQANALASSLYSAMADFGTVESEIERVRQIIGSNPYNLREVYNAFGQKAYSVYGAPIYSWMSATNVDLKTWLYNELGTKDYNVWAQMFTNASIV